MPPALRLLTRALPIMPPGGATVKRALSSYVDEAPLLASSDVNGVFMLLNMSPAL